MRPRIAASTSRLRTVHPAAWSAFAGAIVFAAVFSWLGVRHHRNFGTWSFDMGIYDQAFWLVSRGGQSFMTVRGLEFWGHHVNLVVVLFVPFYWLGAGPAFLYVAQATVMGLGAVPTYLLARDRFASARMGALFAFVFLVYAPVQWIVWANFHPEALVVTPLLAAWWCARRERWRWFALFLVLALSTREDTALAVMMLGLVLLVERRRDAWAVVRRRSALVWYRHRPIVAALGTFVGGIVWYLLCTRLVIPHFNRGNEAFYVRAYFGDYGDSTGAVLGEIVSNPGRVLDDATEPDRLRFYRDLFAPLGFAPLLAPLQLLVAAPQMLASVIGSSPYARQIRWQYTSVMIAPIIVATIDGARRLWRWRWVRPVVVLGIAASSIIGNVLLSNSPVSRNDWVWARPTVRTPTLVRAVSLVPDDVSVVATYSLLPHLTHREFVYDWPNPWVPSYWGVDDGHRLPDPSRIEWLVVDRWHVGESERALLDELIGPQGEFRVVFDRDDVVVARRP